MVVVARRIEIGKGRQTILPPYVHKYTQGSVEPFGLLNHVETCLLYTSPSPRDATLSRMPSSA